MGKPMQVGKVLVKSVERKVSAWAKGRMGHLGSGVAALLSCFFSPPSAPLKLLLLTLVE